MRLLLILAVLAALLAWGRFFLGIWRLWRYKPSRSEKPVPDLPLKDTTKRKAKP